jgi:hypothetical protein
MVLLDNQHPWQDEREPTSKAYLLNIIKHLTQFGELLHP